MPDALEIGVVADQPVEVDPQCMIGMSIQGIATTPVAHPEFTVLG